MSVIVTAPPRSPIAVGLKTTPKAQLADAATAVGQLLLTMVKSPLAKRLAITSVPSPAFVTVMNCGALCVLISCGPKATLVWERLTRGAVCVPTVMPAKSTFRGAGKMLGFRPVGAPKLNVSLPVLVPKSVGVKVTLMVQLEAAASVKAELVLHGGDPAAMAKSPLTPMLVTFNARL